MFNKKSIGLSKLFLISVIAFTGLDLAADDSNQNAIPSIDTDNDGHIDWFEIDVITNGQVHPDWDYGATGFIGLYDYSDSIAEEINAYGPRDYPPKSISYCETNQSRQFPEFVAASRDLMQAENIDAQEMSSHICQHQKITHVIDRENEGNSEHDYLKATFRAVSGDENFEFHGSHESFMEYRLKDYTQNRLKIARSSSLNLSGISELYLDIEIRANSPFPFGNMFMGFNDLRIGISKLGWKNEISFWSFIPVDERCDSYNYRDLDKPFDPSICDFNMIRVPVKSLSRAGIPSVNDLSFLEDLNTISLDFNRGIQQQCQWWWGCELYSISYDIKSVKIVGGDRFPNNPNEYMDSDNDGIGSNSDPDNDNDGIPNELDSFEFNPQAKADLDGDGIANEVDIDSDGDGIPRTSFGINSSHPDGAWFGLDISQDNYGVFFDAATEAGCDVYDLACYGPDLAYSLKVDSLNPLVLVGSNGGVLTWWGGNEFGQDEDDDNDGYLDNLVQPFESGSHRDLFPQDPLAWSDVDLDCVPDNIDNNLNSLSDIDCDGLDDSVDTDDDNDTIPDNLVVPIIEKGLLDNLWQADTNIIDISGSQLCVIEDAGSNPSANCNQLRVSYQQDNEDGESGLMQLDFTQQSAETLWNNSQGIEFKTFSDINIQSMDRGSNLLPAGYFEVELQLTGVTGDEEIGFTLLTSNQEISEKLPKNLKTYWPQVYSGNWTSLKIPLYEFFNHLEYFQYSQLLPYLGRINGLRVHAAPEQNAYSIKIKNMQFVIQDQYISTSQNIWDYNPSLSSIDFDDDGATGSYDEHPFIANIDANENGITDGLESDSLVLRNNIATSIYEFTATNKCNFTPRVALNDKIIVRVDGGNSLAKPNVSIHGQEVQVTNNWGNIWEGEFELTEAPVRESNEVVAANVIDFVKAETSIPEVVAASIFTSDDGLGLSADAFVELVAALEIEFGLDLPDPLLEPGKINTVQQVVNSIQSTELEIPVTVSFQNLNGELGYAELAEEKKLKFCEQNCQCFPDDISGTWENRNAVNAMGVGPEEGNTSFWNINNFDLGQKSCVFDDEYYFGPQNHDSNDTGSFSQYMGDWTWLEAWMSPDGKESCGAPVAPWDGSGTDHTYIWDPENKELTVKGSGAHIGLPRIQNESSADADGPSGKIVYNVATASTCILILDIKGAENWWHFELEKIKDSNGEPMTPEKCAASSGGSGGSSADITTDTDGDGVPDIYDIFPDDSSRTIDTDMDGYANEYDDDDDGDGYLDVDDCAPLDAFVTVCTGSSDSSGNDSAGNDGVIDLSNATEVGPIAFEIQFGGALIAGDGSYSVPTGSEVWAGFSVIPANAMIDVTPFTFGSGGKLTFKASVAGNANADVRFRFEKAPAYDDDVTPTVPSYTTESKTLSGVTETEYTVTILPQGSRTFGSLILYIDTKDVAVSITDVVVSTTPATAGEEIGPFVFTQAFGGSTIPADNTFISTGTDRGGFAVVGADTGIDTNPLYFGDGGTVSFIGSVNGGGSVGVKFEVQADVYPNVLPNYVADVVTVSGSTPKNYSVSIPGQYDNGFTNVVVYLEDLDTEVVMQEIMIGVTAKGDAKAATVAPADFSTGPFEGAAYDEETNTFSFPTSAKSYAGFANNNTELYPMTFDNGGCVTFNASAETDVRIRYKVERQAYPGNMPEMYTDWVTISGTEQEYTVDVPASASAGNTYSSFLLFIDPDYKDLPVGVNTVIATNTGPCGVGLYANNAIEPSQGADGARGLAYSSYTSSDSHQALNGSTTTYLDYSLAKQLPNQLGQVQIPSQFEQIGYRAFKGLDVTSVDIPDSVAKIHSMAFQNNSRLTEINFGNSITHIGAYSFEKTAIKHVTLPDTVTQIGPYAFANSDVEQIYLGNSIEYIGDFAFAGAKISTLIIPSTVKSIGDNAFDYLDGNVYVISPADQVISKFNFPSTAKFFSCLGVDVYGNPGACQESYKLIGNNIFDGPAALRNFQNGHITIPNTYHSIGERAFEEFQGILNSVTIPETVTHIGDYAFKDLGLTSILLPNSVVSIGNGAFAGNQLSNISLPNNLMHVGYAAFAGNNLGYVVLPANLSEVGAGAFINSNLSTVIFPEGLAKIEQNAFANNAITTVNLPSSLHYIGDGAFENNQISSAVFNANGSMGKNSFANNPLTTITLAEDVTSIGGLDSMPPWLSMDYIGEELIIQTADDEIIIVDNDEYNKNGGSIDGIIIGYKQIHSQGEIYTDREVTASSYYYGGIDVIITGTIDPNVAGTQIITYTATDPLGNSASIRGEVVVVDNILPNVSLNGSAVVIVESNAYFEDPGATAFDKVDDKFIDIYTAIELCGSFEDNECKDSQTVTTIDTNSPGTYIATYSAIDSTGNVGIATRQIIVLQGFNEEVVVIKNGEIDALWDKGIYAFDETNDWAAVNDPVNAESIDWKKVNDSDRGYEVLEITHADTDKGAGIYIETSTPVNLLGAKEGGILQFDIKVVSGDPSITIKSGCGFPCGGGPRDLGVQKVGEWTTVRYPVLNMLPGGNDGSTGLDLEKVTTGLEIWATGQRATVFQIDNISWKCVESCEGQEFVPTFTPWEKVDITNGYDAPTSYDGYDLVWSDEFNGTEVDTTKWGFALGNVSPEGNVGWGNSELQHYRPENATVADGMLSIEAQYHSPLLPEVNGNWIPYGARYTSARLETQGKFSFQYGRVDIRAVVAEGKGLWSFGWMLGDNFSTIGWPRAGEIDIVDTIGGPGQEDMIVNNMYWNPVGPSQSEYGKANINDSGFGEVLASEISDIDGETFSNTFHVFSIIWTEDRVDFYVDGILTTPVTLTGTLKETFTQSPFSLILGVAVGGNWAGAPVFEDTDTPTQFPRGMMVDYVRVYQPSTNTPLYQGISNGVTESYIGSNSYVNQFTTDNNQQDTSTDAIQFDWQANETRGVNYSISSNSVDTDGYGENNNIDNDDDGDNVPDYRDDFPLDPNEWLDTDNDGIGNNSDTDDDNDAVFDSIDAFPLNANEWLDTDADGIGNNADNDDDGDRITDINDLFSLSNRDWLDIDLDGIGNNSDIDSDGDGVVNSLDAFPLNSSEWVDTDGAGVGDNADNDDDNDGVLDPDDAFPKDPNQWLFPDTDNDGYRDNNDAFPSDPSEWLDTDADGIGNNADNDDDGDGIDDALDSAPLDATIPGGDDKQIISVMGNPVGVFGKSTLLDIGYSTSNNDNTTTGIGFRVHFDSNLMNVSDVVHVAEKDLIVDATGPLYDDENYDNDDATDQYYTVGWGAIGGDWPNDELPLKVLSLRVEVTQNAGQLDVASTPIKFSYTALASGYNFIAENYNLELVSSTWDFDGSGHADALTDGLIMLRYAFGLRGENLVNGVMDPSSVMTASEVEEKIQSSLDMMDIDKDGTVNALTDGLLLLRYLFDLTGEGLVRDVVSATAERASLHEITQHIERHMPQAIIE